MKKILLLILIIIFTACKTDNKNEITLNLTEDFQTERNHDDNIDSPSFWSNDSLNWVIATSKASGKLLVYDVTSGQLVKEVGTLGNEKGQFMRPNGISVVDNYAFVVERDNKRIQVFQLPEFQSLGFIINNQIIKPYGLYVHKLDTDKYKIFLTDNYEEENEKVPADSLLNKRIHIYNLSINNDSLIYKFEKFFGESKGEGVLRIVESVYGDTLYNNILISEEDTTDSSVKVYDFDGNYKNIKFGKGLFNGQVEGLSLYEDGKDGFWIVTDQSKIHNRFLIFDRKTFEYKGYFDGKNTLNTDGIWLTTNPVGKYKKGVFFAVHDDGNLSFFDFDKILSKFKKADK